MADAVRGRKCPPIGSNGLLIRCDPRLSNAVPGYVAIAALAAETRIHLLRGKKPILLPRSVTPWDLSMHAVDRPYIITVPSVFKRHKMTR
jgi:hypothetical protein